MLAMSEVLQSPVRLTALTCAASIDIGGRDLVLRHEASHVRAASDETQRPTRVTKACESCAASKVKCDESRPCKRCRKRQQPCADGVLDQQASQSWTTAGETQGEDVFGFDPQAVLDGSANTTEHLDGLLGLQDMQVEPSLPSFFENIMVPLDDYSGPQTLELPPDLSDLMPEQDDWLATLDLFGGEFAPTFDSALENGTANMWRPSPQASAGGESNGSDHRSSATARSNIFQRSPQ